MAKFSVQQPGTVSVTRRNGEIAFKDGFELGDRFDVDVAGPNELVVPNAAWPLLETLEQLDDESGRRLTVAFDSVAGHLSVRGLRRTIPDHCTGVWLEYLGQGRFCLRAEQATAMAEDEPLVTDQGVQIIANSEDWQIFRHNRRPAGVASLQLGLRATGLATHGGFDQLICLPMLREMELLDHQLRTMKTVLRRFRGRALLCDEVGLGKTIEAGLVLSELHVRGLVRSVLIVTPPSLVEQWLGEMRRKFTLDCTSYDAPEFRRLGQDAWSRFDRIIVSLHTAKREPHRSAILQRKWDMVIVDEAHHLRSRNTQMWRFVSQLQKQYILLLTATPVQNNLEELFNLVTLLEPGLLSTSKQFQKRFVDRRDKLTPQNVDQLHQLLSEVMVRNRRSTAGLQFTRRWARTERVILGEAEREIYRQVTRFVRDCLSSSPGTSQVETYHEDPSRQARSQAVAETPAMETTGLNRMVLLTLQMMLGSSSCAAASTLRRLSHESRLEDEVRATLARLADRAALQTDNAKVDRLIRLLDEFPDKMVIFTQFRATQDLLAQVLAQHGHDVAVFHGGLSRMEKEAAIQRFRGPSRLLLCSESGSEGRNLQFAHGVCNFDLPWNPMKIEQRIGRLSRIGQTHDVYVFNLVAAGTIEDAVLHLLEAKLNMFELVIGEVDMILGNLDDQREFQDVVADLWSDSADEEDFRARMEALGNRLLAAKEAWIQQRTHDDRIFGDRFAPDKA